MPRSYDKMVYDRNYIVNRANALSVDAHRRGSYGKIPPPDLWLRMELQGWKCMYCKQSISFFSCAFDHVWPVSKGGETYLYNIALTCTACNKRKYARTLKRFCQAEGLDYESLLQEMAEINQRIHNETDWDDEYG